MKVGDWMNSRFQFVAPETPIRKAQALMILRRVNYVVVSRTGDQIDGLVTHADIFRKLLPSQAEYVEKAELRAGAELIEDRYKDLYDSEIRSIMTATLTSVGPSTPLTQAGALMNARRVKQLPVMDGDRLVGIISSQDVSAGILFQSLSN
jgi:CBS domain-containing protein